MRWALLREEIINPSIWSHWATTSAERSDTFHGVNFAEGSKLRGKLQRWVKYFRFQKSSQKKRARRAQTTAENSMEVDVGRAGNSVTLGTPSNENNLGYNNTGVELDEDSQRRIIGAASRHMHIALQILAVLIQYSIYNCNHLRSIFMVFHYNEKKCIRSSFDFD